MSLLIVKRQGPEPRRRRDAADDHVAAPVERPLAVVGRGRKSHAVTGADRKFTTARDRGARVGVDLGGAGFGSRGPGADRQRADVGPARRRHPGGANADTGGDDQRQQGDEDQPHDQFFGGVDVAGPPGAAAAKLSGNATDVDDTGLARFTGSPAVLAASSSIFSTCTRISAPRLVRMGGGPGLMSGGFGPLLAATLADAAGAGSFWPIPTPASSLTSTP